MPEPHYGSQTKARKAALDVLYAAELRGVGRVDLLTETRSIGEQVVRDLTTNIVHGVATNLEAIDARISACVSEAWSLERMPAVDRNLARIAVYELDHTETPKAAVISEAVRLAADLSTDESPDFLSGLLGRIADTPTDH